MIEDLGSKVATVWKELRPVTQRMVVGVLHGAIIPADVPNAKNSYDANFDWELSRLLSALDERRTSISSANNPATLGEINQMAEVCVRLLEAQSGSAEVFIQLAERALKKHDYAQIDNLADRLFERFSASEIAEIVRQTEMPQIRAIGYETLAMLPVNALMPLLDDALYVEIAANALEQKAYEYNSEEARELLDQFDGPFIDREFEN